MKKTSPAKIGIALSGGGPRGIAHIGFIQALHDLGITPSAVTGTSVGSLVGALYCFGVPLEKQRVFAEEMTWASVSRLSPSRYALATNENIASIIDHFFGKKNIEESNIPLAIVATDISNGEKIILRKGDVATAIMASSAIPGMFAPVTIKNRMLVDGGVIENLPLSPLKDMPADFIVANDLMTFRLKQKPTGVSEVINNAFYILISNTRQYHDESAQLIIKPKITSLGRTDKKTLKQMYQAGYEATMEQSQAIQSYVSTS